jgi:sec-independent protein translocase protein TatB
MFDIGWSELLVIAVVALLVIGPKELPEVMRNVGRFFNKMRRTADDFRRQFEDSVKDTGYEDLQRNLREFHMNHPARQLRDSIDKVLNDDGKPRVQGPVEYKPAEGEDAFGMPVVSAAAEPPKPAPDTTPEARSAGGALPVSEGQPAPQPAASSTVYQVTPSAPDGAVQPLANGRDGSAQSAASSSPNKAS